MQVVFAIEARPLISWKQLCAKLHTIQTELDTVAERIRLAEDAVFAPLCKELKIGDVRELQAHQGKLAQEFNERRTQYATQKAKIQMQ